MEEQRLCRCSKPLRPEQQRYCSQACRLEGMRAAKAMKQEPISDAISSGALKHEPTQHGDMYSGTVEVNGEECFVIVGHNDKPNNPDWRRPRQDAEAMQSYHRRPPGWA